MGHESMRSRNYTKEIGISNEERPVPIFVTTTLFVLVVVLALLFARQVNGLKKDVAENPGAPAAVKVSSR
jgi:hypothetical protein